MGFYTRILSNKGLIKRPFYASKETHTLPALCEATALSIKFKPRTPSTTVGYSPEFGCWFLMALATPK